MDLKRLIKVRDGEMVRIMDMATIKVDRQNNCRITVNPDPNRTGNEYFKYYNSATCKRGEEKVARILFKKASYVIHNDGIDTWFPNAKEKRNLIRILNGSVVAKNGVRVTYWQYCILAFNEERWGLDADESMSNIEDKNGKKPFPEALSYNLEMPNYLLLSKNTIENDN